MLRQWPVTAISSCVVNGIVIPPSPPLLASAPAQTGYVLDDSSIAPPGVMQRLSLRGYLFTCGLQNVTVSYTAGYQVTNESAVVPATTPYTISAAGPYGDWASGVSVTYSNGVALVAVSGTPNGGQYSVTSGVRGCGRAHHLWLRAGGSCVLLHGLDGRALRILFTHWPTLQVARRTRDHGVYRQGYTRFCPNCPGTIPAGDYAMNDDGFDPQTVQDALAEQAATFASELEARIQQKLTGEVLQVRSGALAASILSSVDCLTSAPVGQIGRIEERRIFGSS
jgi:hypothetical protein